MSRKIVKRILCKCKNINCNNTIEMRPKEKGRNLLYNLKREDRKSLESIKNMTKKIVAKTPSGRMK